MSESNGNLCAITGEHRIFGCYIRRDLVKAVKLYVIYKDTQNQMIFTRSETHFQHKTKTPDKDVTVYMDSFFYLGTNNGLAVIDDQGWKTYFQQYFPLHLGYHLFSARSGELQVIGLALSRDTSRHVTPSTPITITYPVIQDMDYSNNWTQRLLLGLHFMAYKDWYDINTQWSGKLPLTKELTNLSVDGIHYKVCGGLRYFHRQQAVEGVDDITPDCTAPLKRGGVFELDEHFMNLCPIGGINQFVNIPNAKIAKELKYYHDRIAFYVCAGAKLVVVDEFNEDKDDISGQNRSLIQPGGIIVVDATDLHLEVNAGLSTEKDCFRYYLPFNEFIHVMVPSTEEGKRREVSHISNPVFFLGASESKYNSIVWTLNLKRHVLNTITPEKKTKNGFPEFIECVEEDGIRVVKCKRLSTLVVPDCGNIVAIEEWEDGFDEIVARHSYEQLHRSVTRLINVDDRSYQRQHYHGNLAPEYLPPCYSAPENLHLLRRILKQGERFSKLVCDYRKHPRYDYSKHKPLPTEYHFSEIKINTNLEEVLQVPLPAAYPPVLIDDHLYYLPQKLNYKNTVLDLSKIYPLYDENNVKQIKVGETTLLMSDTKTMPLKEYSWTKFRSNDRLNANKTDWEMPVDSTDIKLCIDGHWYGKQLKDKGNGNESPHLGDLITFYYKIQTKN